MSEFIVAFIGWHDHELYQESVKAENSIDAMLQVLHKADWDTNGVIFETEEQVKQFAFDCDHMISAYEI